MRNILAKTGRRGSVAVMVGGIVLALLIFFGAFIKYSSSRQYATKRLNRILLAREFSSALATLACNQLKEDIRKADSKLVKSLEKPLTLMSKESTDKIVFADTPKAIIGKLEKFNSELNELSWQVNWKVKKDDFKAISAAYPREKTGLVRIHIDIEYLAPASLEKIKEEYLYTINLKVVANLLPVLSKFTLYVKDAGGDDDAERFNLIVNDENGNLLEKTYRPWVLKHSGNVGPFPSAYADVVKSSRGLVYLGGGRLNLGVARGWNDGDYSEGFHLLGEDRRSTFYKTGSIGAMALLNRETGLCKTDFNNSGSVSWYDLIKGGYAEMSAKTSIFKLYGTDKERSPTLVLGDVYARTICGKAYRGDAENYGPLPYTYDDNQFNDYNTTAGGADFDFSYFMNVYADNNSGAILGRAKYNAGFASRLIEVPYNRALGYIMTNHNNPWPLDSGRIAASDPLYDFVSGKDDNVLAKKIPAPYSGIYNDIQDLSAMKELLTRSEITGRRAMAEITLLRGEELMTVLHKRGYLHDGKLDLNGWLYVRAADGIVIDKPLELISHGGIVLEKGTIEIKNAIKSDGSKFLLNLVACRGNIIVSSSLNGQLDVGLTAAGEGSDVGQVKFAGDGNSSTITINGNVAMQKIAKGSLDNSCARGVVINYAEALSALPKNTSEDRSERPLLMYSFAYPRLLD